jgi:signal transduction histidine kinase
MTAKVLIVDDAKAMRSRVPDILRQAGYDVFEAADGAAARAAALQVDLVVLDVVLPDMGGIELCRQLRRQQATRLLPIVLVSPRRHHLAGIEVGVDDILHTPVDEPELLARVASLLRIKAQRDAVERQQRDRSAMHVHDLRSPLASIIGFATLMREGLVPDRHQELLARIEVIGGRMLRHIDDLLDISGLDSGYQTVSTVPTDLVAMLDDLVQDLQPQAVHRDITLRFLRATLPAVLIDARRMRQVLMNLIDNAVKFARQAVVVQCFLSEGQVHVTIADDGPGVPENELPLLWERWHQTNSGRLQATGTGLGLPIAKGLVEAHNGTIGVRNRGRGGLMMHVRLPIMQSQALVA